MCFPSNYTKTSIKSLIRYGNASGAICKVQLLECRGGLKTIRQSHQSVVVLKQKQQQHAFGTITWKLLFQLIWKSNIYSTTENSISRGPSYLPEDWSVISKPTHSLSSCLLPRGSRQGPYPFCEATVLVRLLANPPLLCFFPYHSSNCI